MARMSFLVALLLAAPALAGCIGSSDDVEPEPASTDDATNEAMGDAMADELAQSDAPEAEAPQTIVTTVSETIAFASGAWVCEHTAVGQCEWLGAGTFESSFEPAFEGMFDGYELTFTWEAGTPLMETLNFGVYAYVGEEHEVLVNDMAGGTSPVTISGSNMMLPGDASVWIWAWPDCQGNEQTHACLLGDQQVNVEGTVTSMVMDAASADAMAGHEM